MSQYLNRSDGPGSIGALTPLVGLSHPPTIGSNAPRRVIGNVSHGPQSIPAMGMGAYSSGVLSNGDGVFDGFGGLGAQGCGCMGTDEAAAAADDAAAAADVATAAANAANAAADEAAAAANGNGNGFMGLPSWAPIVGIAAIAGGVWYMKKKKDEEAAAML